ncbi:MAG: NUDIX hydrolase [Candidatus Nanoarchaeia archaeon]|nr:NUDIX hydrolase [Candidatus Nanoarchaeia archaeon]
MNTEKLPLRKNVLGIVFKGDEFLIVQKQYYKDNEWSVPGGGVEKSEKSEKALLREMKEELGTDKFKIIKKSNITYEWMWPMENIERRKYKWKGQHAEIYIVEFMGNKKDIKKQKDEIRKVKWVKKEELKQYLIFQNQYKTITKAIKGIK